MDNFMDWLYFQYIVPVIEEDNRGECGERMARLRGFLDVRQAADLERVIEYYASSAFRLGLRTGYALNGLISDEP